LEEAVNYARHPGHILRDLLKANNWTPEHFASRIGPTILHIERVKGLLRRQRKIVRDSAALLARGFDQAPFNTAGFWMRAQELYENGALEPDNFTPIMHKVRKCGSSDIGNRVDPQIREEVLALVEEGMTSEQAGQQVGLEKMQVAGIRAANTKGQYD
jgi:plasmid maintenance system antidote protein VapI